MQRSPSNASGTLPALRAAAITSYVPPRAASAALPLVDTSFAEVGGLSEVRRIVPYSRSKLYDLMKHGSPPFPAPIKLKCANRSLWDLAAVRAWLASQVADVVQQRVEV